MESSTVWETNGKTFEKWICPLVYSLIGHSNDVILRFLSFYLSFLHFFFGQLANKYEIVLMGLIFCFQIMSRYCVAKSWDCWASFTECYSQSSWKKGFRYWSSQTNLTAGFVLSICHDSWEHWHYIFHCCPAFLVFSCSSKFTAFHIYYYLIDKISFFLSVFYGLIFLHPWIFSTLWKNRIVEQ